MKLQLRDLITHLRRPLSRLYWVSGDDIFLGNQAIKDITAAALTQGFSIERNTFSAGSSFSLEAFFTLTRSLSLFDSERCIILTLEVSREIKVSSAFLEALGEYLKAKDPSLVLVISSGKLPASLIQQQEFKALEHAINHLAIWPLDREQVPAFLIQQAKRYHLYLDLEVARRLAVLTEGNLFAADQILEKFSLSPNSHAKKISQEDLDQMSENQARFEVFDLISAVLRGETPRVWQIFTQLQAQKIEPILILWALAKEVRLLAKLHEEIQSLNYPNYESALSELFKRHKFWEKRAKDVGMALRRVSYSQCLGLLQYAAKIDRVLKGAESGEVSLLLADLLRGMLASHRLRIA